VTERLPAAATPRLALILALLATLGSYTIDAFFPSMRAMAGNSASAIGRCSRLTVYLVPYACMSLVHGSLSDAVPAARRAGGAGAVRVASAGCALARDLVRCCFFAPCREWWAASA
jgi:DHA1 family bicyclomycin/chloramphenicol resistance-like MFS transporter